VINGCDCCGELLGVLYLGTLIGGDIVNRGGEFHRLPGDTLGLSKVVINGGDSLRLQ
jgi:hypothetical protein